MVNRSAKVSQFNSARDGNPAQLSRGRGEHGDTHAEIRDASLLESLCFLRAEAQFLTIQIRSLYAQGRAMEQAYQASMTPALFERPIRYAHDTFRSLLVRRDVLVNKIIPEIERGVAASEELRRRAS